MLTLKLTPMAQVVLFETVKTVLESPVQKSIEGNRELLAIYDQLQRSTEMHRFRKDELKKRAPEAPKESTYEVPVTPGPPPLRR